VERALTQVRAVQTQFNTLERKYNSEVPLDTDPFCLRNQSVSNVITYGYRSPHGSIDVVNGDYGVEHPAVLDEGVRVGRVKAWVQIVGEVLKLHTSGVFRLGHDLGPRVSDIRNNLLIGRGFQNEPSYVFRAIVV
jgi:hypothetical protein